MNAYAFGHDGHRVLVVEAVIFDDETLPEPVRTELPRVQKVAFGVAVGMVDGRLSDVAKDHGLVRFELWDAFYKLAQTLGWTKKLWLLHEHASIARGNRPEPRLYRIPKSSRRAVAYLAGAVPGPVASLAAANGLSRQALHAQVVLIGRRLKAERWVLTWDQRRAIAERVRERWQKKKADAAKRLATPAYKTAEVPS